MDVEHLSLRWQDHHESLLSVFENLLRSNTLVDCTLAADGHYLKAHKVVLSACSPYFQLLFKEESEKHPIIFLKDVKFWTLKAVVDFVYCGEVKIEERQLGPFLEVAESLQIKGLGTDRPRGSDNESPTTPSGNFRNRNCSFATQKQSERNRCTSPETKYCDINDKDTKAHGLTETHSADAEASSGTGSLQCSAATNLDGPSSSYIENADQRTESNRSLKAFAALEAMPREDIPVIKVEPDTDLYHEAKIEFGDNGRDEYMEGTSLINDMVTETNLDSLHFRNMNPNVDLMRYGDISSHNTFLTAQIGSQDLPEANVETIDLSSEDSTFHSMHGDRILSLGGAAGRPGAPRGAPPLACPECGRLFASADGLALHRRRHAGARPHRCADCGRAFNRSDHLLVHRRKHTGERPYRCGECGHAFKLSHHLKVHLRLHTGERPYRCSEAGCHKGFAQVNTLKRHLQVHARQRHALLAANPATEPAARQSSKSDT